MLKDDKSNLQLNIKGIKEFKKNILFKNFLNEEENNIEIKDLLLKDNFSLIEFKSIDLDYLIMKKSKIKFQ